MGVLADRGYGTQIPSLGGLGVGFLIIELKNHIVWGKIIIDLQ